VLYNSTLKNHLYTTDTNEKNILIRSGWSIDNGGNPVFCSGGSVPIYRTYNAGISGVHLLITDSNEYNTLGVQGWSKEGVKLYAVSIGKLIAPSFAPTALVQGFTTALGAPWLGSINVDATATINKISTNFTIYNGSYKNYSQCVALIEYYLSQHGRGLSGVVYGYGAAANSGLAASSAPIIGGLFSVPANEIWLNSAVGYTGHTGIIIGIKSGVSFTTLENNFASSLAQVVHPWSDISHANFTVKP